MSHFYPYGGSLMPVKAVHGEVIVDVLFLHDSNLYIYIHTLLPDGINPLKSEIRIAILPFFGVAPPISSMISH